MTMNVELGTSTIIGSFVPCNTLWKLVRADVASFVEFNFLISKKNPFIELFLKSLYVLYVNLISLFEFKLFHKKSFYWKKKVFGEKLILQWRQRTMDVLASRILIGDRTDRHLLNRICNIHMVYSSPQSSPSPFWAIYYLIFNVCPFSTLSKTIIILKTTYYQNNLFTHIKNW